MRDCIPDEISEQYSGHSGSGRAIPVLNVLTREERDSRLEELISFSGNMGGFILSIPHSGLLMPRRFTDNIRMRRSNLMEVDLFTDVVYGIGGGFSLVCRIPRFLLDMNRKREGSDDPGLRRHMRSDPIHYIACDNLPMVRREFSGEKTQELLGYYDLYHGIIGLLARRMKERLGYALLLDCHSMPSKGMKTDVDPGRGRDDFVVGTHHGTSAGGEVASAFLESLRESSRPHGFTVSADFPYSGGFITKNHCSPGEGIHAIQLEVNMKNYMHEGTDRDASMRYTLRDRDAVTIRSVISVAVKAAREAAGGS